MFHVLNNTPFLPSSRLFLSNVPSIHIDVRARHPLGAGYERRRFLEELVHVFQVQAFGLGLEGPEEEGVA